MATTNRDEAARNETTRVAMIGLGGATERILLPALSRLPGVRVVAGSDPDPGARAHATSRWGIAPVYADMGEMLERERPEIAVVATPPLTHRDLVLRALDHGCHVFCEKPFMPSVEDCDRVISAAQRAGRQVAVNNQYYEMPIYRVVREELNNGRAGRLYSVDVWQRMYLLPEAEGGWKAALQPRRVLYEFGTHALDLLCQFFRAYPVSVSARIPRVRPDVNADVFTVLRLDFPDERVATLVLNRTSHAPKKYLEMRLDCAEASIRVSLGGVAYAGIGWNSALGRPRLRLALASGGEARLERDGSSRFLARQSRTAFADACAVHFSHFLAAIREGTAVPVSAAHAREVLRVVFAAYESAERQGELARL